MSKIHRSTHSQRLEKWLGIDKIEGLSRAMKGWPGPPIHLLDCPGSVRVSGDGDFSGPFDRGYFMSAFDALEAHLKRSWRAASKPQPGILNTGFASIAEALAQSSKGFRHDLFFNKSTAGTINRSESLHKLAGVPVAGAAAAAAPAGTAPVDSDQGGLPFTNPSVGTTRLVGINASAENTPTFACNASLLLYDRIFAVAKTMNSTATEAVTGVPTRYQSTTPTAENYIGGNFGFVETGLTALAATAHNWTVCTYVNQAGGGSTLPSLTGAASTPVNTLDHPVQQWFAPLAAGDTGIGAWTQMQCSASVATGLIDFVIGHPIGFMSFPYSLTTVPFDWLTNRDQAPRIFDDAYLAFLEVISSAGDAITYSGHIEMVSTSS